MLTYLWRVSYWFNISCCFSTSRSLISAYVFLISFLQHQHFLIGEKEPMSGLHIKNSVGCSETSEANKIPTHFCPGNWRCNKVHSFLPHNSCQDLRRANTHPECPRTFSLSSPAPIYQNKASFLSLRSSVRLEVSRYLRWEMLPRICHLKRLVLLCFPPPPPQPTSLRSAQDPFLPSVRVSRCLGTTPSPQ